MGLGPLFLRQLAVREVVSETDSGSESWNAMPPNGWNWLPAIALLELRTLKTKKVVERTTGESGDDSHLPHQTIMERLPRVYQTMIEVQTLDITREPIKIAPTAHHSMGCVFVHHEDHSTDVAGRYTIGEASSGLHGANQPPQWELIDRAAAP